MSKLQELLTRLDNGLSNWMYTCNPDEVNLDEKEKANQRMMVQGGTLVYITSLREEINKYKGQNPITDLTNEQISNLMGNIELRKGRVCWLSDERPDGPIYLLVSPLEVFNEAIKRGLSSK